MNHLLISHPNMKNTGAAVRFELHPAQDGIEGAIVAILAPQKTVGAYSQDTITPPTFDWCNCVDVRLSPLEIASMLEVLRGYHESIGNGIFHYSATKATTIRFTHNIEPINSYCLELAVRKLPDGDLKTVRISLSPTEALALECAISHSLHLLAFGVPSIFND